MRRADFFEAHHRATGQGTIASPPGCSVTDTRVAESGVDLSSFNPNGKQASNQGGEFDDEESEE